MIRKATTSNMRGIPHLKSWWKMSKSQYMWKFHIISTFFSKSVRPRNYSAMRKLYRRIGQSNRKTKIKASTQLIMWSFWPEGESSRQDEDKVCTMPRGFGYSLVDCNMFRALDNNTITLPQASLSINSVVLQQHNLLFVISHIIIGNLCVFTFSIAHCLIFS